MHTVTIKEPTCVLNISKYQTQRTMVHNVKHRRLCNASVEETNLRCREAGV